MPKSFDVAVIGAGVFGVWTACSLQRSGHAVVLIDAYGFNIAFRILAVSYIAEMALMLFVTDPRNSSTGEPKSDATSAG